MKPIHPLACLTLLLGLTACGTAPSPRSTSRGELDPLARLVGDLDRQAQDGEAPTPAADSGHDSGWQGSVSGLIGGRALDDERFWDPVDGQFAAGIEFETRPAHLPIGFEAGLLFGVGYEDNVGGTSADVTSSVGELYLGPRLTFELGESVRPYAGGGITFLSAATESEVALQGGGRLTRDDDDGSVGAYAHAGVQIDVADGLHVGADVRGVFGTDVTLFGTGTDADYVQVTLLVGANW